MGDVFDPATELVATPRSDRSSPRGRPRPRCLNVSRKAVPASIEAPAAGDLVGFEDPIGGVEALASDRDPEFGGN